MRSPWPETLAAQPPYQCNEPALHRARADVRAEEVGFEPTVLIAHAISSRAH